MTEAERLATPVRRSPLLHRSPIGGRDGEARLWELPFLGKFILRVDPHAAGEPLRDALGLGLPFDALTSSTSAEASWLWFGPDEWMLVTAPDDPDRHEGRAREALEGVSHQIVDVTDFYTVICVGGGRARELLMKLTTLDMHPRAFTAGMVAGSVFARVNAVLWLPAAGRDEADPAFRLLIRWSMADHLWCALAEAVREWGVAEQRPVAGEALTIN